MLMRAIDSVIRLCLYYVKRPQSDNLSFTVFLRTVNESVGLSLFLAMVLGLPVQDFIPVYTHSNTLCLKL